MKEWNIFKRKIKKEDELNKESTFKKTLKRAAIIGTAATALGGAMEMQPKPAEAQQNKEYVATYNPRAAERIYALKDLKALQDAGYEIIKKLQDTDGNEHYEFMTPNGIKMITVPPASEVAGPKEIKKPYSENKNKAEYTGGPTESKEFQWKR